MTTFNLRPSNNEHFQRFHCVCAVSLRFGTLLIKAGIAWKAENAYSEYDSAIHCSLVQLNAAWCNWMLLGATDYSLVQIIWNHFTHLCSFSVETWYWFGNWPCPEAAICNPKVLYHWGGKLTSVRFLESIITYCHWMKTASLKTLQLVNTWIKYVEEMPWTVTV